MQYAVRIEQLSAQPLAVVRRCAAAHELSKVVPAACGTVWNVIRSQQVAGAGRHVAVYLDGQINLEVGRPGRHHDPLRPVRPAPRGASGDLPVVQKQRARAGGT